MSRNLWRNRVLAVLVAVSLAGVLPGLAYGADGKKHFKQGMKYEQNKQWDKAAEQYALASAENPSNIEYQLHLQRALVNAGLMLVERGDMFAEQKDHKAAYQAYRQAYAFDPANEMALIKMRRMLEAQGLSTEGLPKGGDPAGPSYQKKNGSQTLKTSTSSVPSSNGAAGSTAPAGTAAGNAQQPTAPTRVPVYRVKQRVKFFPGTSLQTAITQLAAAMNLNVIYDTQVANLIRNPNPNFSIELNDVTPARALEMILKANNLMYAQMDRRTIVIASDNMQTRQRYEPVSVRTFYIKNADIMDVRTVIQTTLTGSKQVVPSKQLNALIVRDTPANLELIEGIINSLDKSKAEVLIDVNLYEVSRQDLIDLGNQFSTSPGSVTIGGDDESDSKGTSRPTPGLRALGGFGAGATLLTQGTRMLTGPWGLALGIPASTLSFFQDKGKSRLLASTQVHVLDNESHQIRIGQRVPIRTASLPFVGSGGTPGGQNPNPGTNPGFLSGFGIDQIQYENVGLNIDMTPNVFEDEIQIKMKIESSSIDGSTSTLTPIFSQRQLSSVARIKDGQTTMVAGVSQSQDRKNVKGIPLIGLIPILGRFFSTPDTGKSHSDVVITVTPHILRRADIREEDHLARESGTGLNSGRDLTIEEILYMADKEESQQTPVAQSGTQPQDKLRASVPEASAPPPAPSASAVTINTATTGVVVNPPPIQGSPGSLPVQRRSVSAPGVRPNQPDEDEEDENEDETDTATQAGPITVSVRGASVASKGQQYFAAIIVVGNSPIGSATISLSYDPNILELKSVRNSGLIPGEPKYSGQNGLLNIQIDRQGGAGGLGATGGNLVLVVFDVKGQGQTTIALGEDTMFRSSAGQVLQARFESLHVEAR